MRSGRLPGPTILLALALTGCSGVAPRSSLYPAAADLSHPGGKATMHVEVTPRQATSPVGTEQILIATLTDPGGGSLKRRRRIEWRLAGVGSIQAVDESGFLIGKGHKIDDHYAVSYTETAQRRVDRHTGNPADDLVLGPGQTWCAISAPVEGDTQVTVQAAGVSGLEGQQIVTRRWIDARWSLPPAHAERVGGQVPLITTLYRQTDGRIALPGYRVRYRILDGPPAVLVPGGSSEAVLITDQSGLASIGIVQARPAGGVSRVGIEIFRPPEPGSADRTGALLGQGETTVEWQAAALALEETLPPSVVLGQPVTCVLNVSNTGTLAADFVTVRASKLEGMKYVRSNPAANEDGNQLVWTLNQLAAQGKRALEVVYQPTRTGASAGWAVAAIGKEPAIKQTFQTQVLPEPQVRLRVEQSGPTSGLVVHTNGNLMGITFTHQLTVSNLGTDTAHNVRLRLELDPGLAHESGVNPVEWPLGELTPGTRRSVAVTLRPNRAGRAVNRITALADNKVVGQGEQVVTVQEAGVDLKLTGPQTCYVGKPVDWELEVTNSGATTLGQVVVSAVLPPELAFVSATDGGRPQGQMVVWSLDQLKPKEAPRKLVLKTTATRLAPHAVCQAQVNAVSPTQPPDARAGTLVSAGVPPAPAAGQGLQARAEAAVALQGLPAFKLKVTGRGPIEVGERTTYTIDVINRGSLPGAGVQVIGTLPPQMRLLAAGPLTYTLDGQKVIFAPYPALPVNYMLHYVLEVQGAKAGDARFRAELKSANLQTPVAKENSIAVHAVETPGAGAIQAQTGGLTPRRTPGEPGTSATGVPSRISPVANVPGPP